MVTETILADHSKGIVKIDGQEWRACSVNGVEIEKGENVVIQRLQGVKIYVKKQEEKI